jgi:hypothetical protein
MKRGGLVDGLREGICRDEFCPLRTGSHHHPHGKREPSFKRRHDLLGKFGRRLALRPKHDVAALHVASRIAVSQVGEHLPEIGHLDLTASANIDAAKQHDEDIHAKAPR